MFAIIRRPKNPVESVRDIYDNLGQATEGLDAVRRLNPDVDPAEYVVVAVPVPVVAVPVSIEGVNHDGDVLPV